MNCTTGTVKTMRSGPFLGDTLFFMCASTGTHYSMLRCLAPSSSTPWYLIRLIRKYLVTFHTKNQPHVGKLPQSTPCRERFLVILSHVRLFNAHFWDKTTPMLGKNPPKVDQNLPHRVNQQLDTKESLLIVEAKEK